jgi:putative transposase
MGALEDVAEAVVALVGTARCAVRGRRSAASLPRSVSPMKRLPIRERLPHDVPLWVDPARESYFITISCKQPGGNQLAHPDVANALFETVQHRNDMGVWYVHVALLMPDHVHLIVSFPETGKRIQTIISKWKEWTAKTIGISWHRDFFEHRLRQDESFRQKADYVLRNPIRAGLAKTPEDWPYVFIANPW